MVTVVQNLTWSRPVAYVISAPGLSKHTKRTRGEKKQVEASQSDYSFFLCGFCSLNSLNKKGLFMSIQSI